MTSQDMIEEIRSLRSEMGTLGDHMVRLRYADIKSAFLEQIRVAVGEEGRRTFQSEAPTLTASSQCELKSVCLAKLEGAVDAAADRFMRDDVKGAKELLDEVEGLISGECSACQDDDCSRGAKETVRRVRAVLQVYDGLITRLGPGPSAVRAAAPREPVPADRAERILDPLANAWRIKVLTTLRRGERSLSELGRAVELRTGHLQFHLRALIEAGYVEADRRRHLYRITERGVVALQWTEEIVHRLGPGPDAEDGDAR
ncbi:MAG: winged helix-turn-helix domain-containing protein [Methanomassiliicoccus sp.]|nr:winged helix-turn-helix domain-containing protein [Methanomassiliicoccus sp.]